MLLVIVSVTSPGLLVWKSNVIQGGVVEGDEPLIRTSRFKTRSARAELGSVAKDRRVDATTNHRNLFMAPTSPDSDKPERPPITILRALGDHDDRGCAVDGIEKQKYTYVAKNEQILEALRPDSAINSQLLGIGCFTSRRRVEEAAINCILNQVRRDECRLYKYYLT
jgi:hypothetical protein